jgi:uncharacterized protein
MPNGNTTLADITSADWQLMLDANSPQSIAAGTVISGSGIGNVEQNVADINQCIGIILTTPQGSDPLRPTFACDLWKWLDAPVNIARPHLVREIVTALTKWESRIRVLSVLVNLVSNAAPPPSSSSMSNNGGGESNVNAHLDITIVWQLKVTVSGGTSQQLTITVPTNLA